MRYVVAFIFLLASQAVFGCQMLGQVEVVGMAQVGDFMRVKTLDSTGEVKTMEALPAGDILRSFSTTYAGADELRVAKVMEIETPLVGDYWEGAFLVANQGSFSILNLRVRTDGTGTSYITGAISSATGTRFKYYYTESLERFTVYVGADNSEKRFSGFSLLNTAPEIVTFYTNSPFTETTGGKSVLASVASVDDASGDLLANTLRPIDPVGGLDIIAFDDVTVGSILGRLILHDAESWHAVGGAGEPAFENGWENFGSDLAVAAFRKLPTGMVTIKGLVKNGTANTTIFTLPAGYRPSDRRIFSVEISYNVHARITVGTDGTIAVTGGAAGQTTYTSLEISFYP
jgi:hypothetical protein